MKWNFSPADAKALNPAGQPFRNAWRRRTSLLTVEELIETLGHPDDDASNTFTALLLLFESVPLLETGTYWTIIEEIITQYRRDFEGHETEFIPAFLANDILRLWRTFCVNYEARTQTEPPVKKAKRKLKNYNRCASRPGDS